MKQLAVFLSALLASAPLAAHAAQIDPSNSRISTDKTDVRADGIQHARITVTARDQNLLPVTGAKVLVESSRGKMDLIRAQADTTDTLGKAYFEVGSLRNGTSIYTAQVNNIAVQHEVTIAYTGGLVADIGPGDLIKIPDDQDAKTLSDTAVYYYGVDGRRYVFPNEKVYFTWYADFSKVKVIQIDQMSLIPIGGNVTYKAGSKLVKFQTDVKTYLPTKGGALRWVQTEEAARGLFGSEWNRQVDDVSEAFYANYTFGTPIASALDAALDVIRASGGTINADKGLE